MCFNIHKQNICHYIYVFYILIHFCYDTNNKNTDIRCFLFHWFRI